MLVVFTFLHRLAILPLMIAWHTKRQLLFFGLFAIVVLMLVGYFAYIIYPGSTCFDGQKNQGEEGVDCGGACQKQCIQEDLKDLVIFWNRFFKVRPGLYDVAALVENRNISVGARTIEYVFHLYDTEGELIISRQGVTYSLPNQQFLAFESGLDVGSRIPGKLTFEFKPFSWELTDEQTLPVKVAKTDRLLTQDRPRLVATLANSSIRNVPRVEVTALISDPEGNAIGAARSLVPLVPDTSTEDAVFTWPFPFEGNPTNVTMFLRQNPWDRL